MPSPWTLPTRRPAPQRRLHDTRQPFQAAGDDQQAPAIGRQPKAAPGWPNEVQAVAGRQAGVGVRGRNVEPPPPVAEREKKERNAQERLVGQGGQRQAHLAGSGHGVGAFTLNADRAANCRHLDHTQLKFTHGEILT